MKAIKSGDDSGFYRCWFQKMLGQLNFIWKK